MGVFKLLHVGEFCNFYKCTKAVYEVHGVFGLRIVSKLPELSSGGFICVRTRVREFSDCLELTSFYRCAEASYGVCKRVKEFKGLKELGRFYMCPCVTSGVLSECMQSESGSSGSVQSKRVLTSARQRVGNLLQVYVRE